MSSTGRELADLQARFDALEQENELLSDRLEESVLMGHVAEAIESLQSIDEVLPTVLERISVMKGIASCAYCTVNKGQVIKLATYCQDCSVASEACHLWLPFDLAEEPPIFPRVLGKKDLRPRAESAGVCLLASGASAVGVIPFANRPFSNAFLVLADQVRSEGEMAELLPTMSRLMKMVSNRLDNLSLLGDLKSLTEDLDRRVEERTREAFQRELQYRTLFESVPDAVLLINVHHVPPSIVSVNLIAGQVYGYRSEELVGASAAIIGRAYEARALAARLLGVEKGATFRGSFECRHKDGTLFPVDVVERMIQMSSGSFLLSFHRDITVRKAAEQKLQQNEERMRRAQSIAHVGNWEIDLVGQTLWGSAEACNIYGFAPIEDVLALSNVQSYVLPEDRARMDQGLRKLIAGEGPYDLEYKIRRASDGALRTLHSRAERVLSPDGVPIRVVGAVQDITERAEAQESLRGLLREKDVLLRELYHRTKNNMGVICSMLSLRAAHVKNREMLRILRDTESRIRSMALVHQKLYQSMDLSRIALREYVGDLAALVVNSLAFGEDRVSLELDVVDVEVPIDIAIPVGQILHELFANVFRHAYPEGQSGTVRVSIAPFDHKTLVLSFADDGVGLPPGMSIRNTTSLGVQTVVGIVEDQLGGTVKVTSPPGVTWEITFCHDV